MKLYHITDPHNYDFAVASRVGTWDGKKRISPMVIEWEPGSDLIGDFTWPGIGSEIVITERVAHIVNSTGLDGYSLGPVVVKDHAEARVRKLKRKKRVKFPYTGPELFDLSIPKVFLHADPERSSFVELPPEPDGTIIFKTEGGAKLNFNKSTGYEWKITPRTPGKGLYVKKELVEGLLFFRIRQLPGAVFCSDIFKQLAEEHNFTNILFLEYGELF